MIKLIIGLCKEYYRISLKILCVGSFMLFQIIESSAQQNVSDSYLSSPSAAELGSYGQFSTGLFTGTPDVNIPLYTVKTKNLNLPISLNYRSNGMLVNKISSNVGFDWSLFAGGVITRIVKGFPDESQRHTNVVYPIDPNKTGIDLTPTDKTKILEFFYSTWEVDSDTQPDLFAYNFAGYSGQFYFDSNHSPITVPYQKLKIQKNTSITITTPDGILYEFNPTEIAGGFTPMTYHLTKIKHPEGDEINFSYKQAGTYWYGTGISDNLFTVEIDKTTYPECLATLPINRYPKVQKSISIASVVLDAIEVPGYGKVVFETDNNRLDVPELRIKGLNVYDYRGKRIRSVDLVHEFPHTTSYGNNLALEDNDGFGRDNVNYRMFLNQVVIKGSDETVEQRYSFDYKDIQELPIRLSYAQDHWGFFNGIDNSTLLPDHIPVGIKNVKLSRSSYGVRNPNSDYASKGMLIGVRYPTGGYSSFEYEANRDYTGVQDGGVRVVRQRNYNVDGRQADMRRYVYESPAASSSDLNYYQQYSFASECVPIQDGTGSTANPSILVTNYVYWLRSTAKQLPGLINYGKVIVYHHDDVNRYDREVHEFNVFPDEYPNGQMYGQYVNYPIELNNNSWKTGQKRNESFYSSDDRLLKSTTFNYHEDTRHDMTKSYVEVERFSSPIMPINDHLAISNYFNVRRYSIISKWNYLKSVTTKEIDPINNTELTTKIDYHYDNADHAQLTREVTVNSRGINQTKRLSYPTDYPTVGLFEELNAKFIVNKIVDERIYRGPRLVSGIQKKYNSVGQPTDVYQAELASSLLDVPLDPANPYTFRHRVKYQYNEKKLLSGVNTDEGINTSYLWSYKRAHPVAQIDNASFDNIKSLVVGLGPEFLNTLEDTGDDQEIENSLVSLRQMISNALPMARINTFTHYPLIGLRSSSDPNEKITHFGYDTFGRLYSVKDDDSNLMKTYRYYYMPPSAYPRLRVSPASLSFRYQGDLTKVIEIDSHGGAWSISIDQDWIQVSESNGAGISNIAVSVDGNLSTASRSGNIRIKDLSGNHFPELVIPVSQEAHPNYVHINYTSLTFGNNAGNNTFEIASNVAWEIVNDQPWVSISHVNGQGNQVVTVTVSENTSYVDRNTQLKVRDMSGNNSPDQFVTLSQVAAPNPYYLNANLSEMHFNGGSETANLFISSNTSWAIQNYAPWISVTPNSGVGTGFVSIAVSQNTSSDERWATFQVAGEHVTPPKLITVTQAGVSDYITLSTSHIYINGTISTEGSFNIYSNLTSWSARIKYITGTGWLDVYPMNSFLNRAGSVEITQLPPAGQTWVAEVEFYNTLKAVSSKMFVYVNN